MLGEKHKVSQTFTEGPCNISAWDISTHTVQPWDTSTKCQHVQKSLMNAKMSTC